MGTRQCTHLIGCSDGERKNIALLRCVLFHLLQKGDVTLSLPKLMANA